MRRRIYILAAAFILVACSGEKSAIEKALKEDLFDPVSVIIYQINISDDGLKSCIKYNNKNKFGIYSGKKHAKLEKTLDQWVVQDTDVYAISCTSEGFRESNEVKIIPATNLPQYNAEVESIDAVEDLEFLMEALTEALDVAISAMRKGQSISREAAISSLKEGKCSSNFVLFETVFVNRAEITVRGGDATSWEGKINELLESFQQGHCEPAA